MIDQARQKAQFLADGWLKFDRDASILDWLQKASLAALATRDDPANKHWLVGQDTWFVGVNALANNGAGVVDGSGPLLGNAMDFIRGPLGFGAIPLDRAQVSICYPGFPKPRDGESEKSFAFRRDRDAAHLDGLHPNGKDKRRKQAEFQGFLLGIPVTKTSDRASPMAVWRGSHKILARMYERAFLNVPNERWSQIDLTEVYHEARQEVFETCERVLLHSTPGQSYVLHPMVLHGVAPWKDGALAPKEGRVILYFRPEVSRANWGKF